jgi:hypothetical protein
VRATGWQQEAKRNKGVRRRAETSGGVRIDQIGFAAASTIFWSFVPGAVPNNSYDFSLLLLAE